MLYAKLILLIAVVVGCQAGEAPLAVTPNGQEVRLPVPSSTEISQTRKAIQDLFKDDYSKAKTSTEKHSFASKLLEQAKQTNDDSLGKYVCLTEALRFATEAASLDLANSTINHLTEFFAVDASVLRRKALADVIALSKDFESQRAVGALKTLDTNLSDPAANLLLGKYLCFNRELWDLGLPHLANSGDENLKLLAAEELGKPADALAMAALADAWWELSTKEPEPKKSALQRHAGVWYRQAVTDLSGLSRAKVEKRITEIPTPSAQASTVKSGPTSARKINLLSLLDPSRDTVRGTWRMNDTKLICESGGRAAVQFPYKAPAEFDYRIVFIRQQGAGGMSHMFCVNNRAIMWNVSSWADQYHVFENCDGKEGNANDSQVRTTSETKTTNGKQSESILRVRKGYIECLVNGKVVQKWDQIDRLECHSGWALKDRTLVGLGTNNSRVEYLTAEIIELSGPGTITIQPNANATKR